MVSYPIINGHSHCLIFLFLFLYQTKKINNNNKKKNNKKIKNTQKTHFILALFCMDVLFVYCSIKVYRNATDTLNIWGKETITKNNDIHFDRPFILCLCVHTMNLIYNTLSENLI